MKAHACVAAALIAAPLALVLSQSIAADEPPKGPADLKLPWNPADGAVAGDWTQYRVFDPASPAERLPPERFKVRGVEGGIATIVDTLEETFRFKLGPEGTSAKAFLHGFFGEARDSQLCDLRTISMAEEGIEVAGKRYECVRLDASLISNVTAAQSGEAPSGEMKATFKIWVAKGVRVNGIVRADAAVEFAGRTHRGVLELEAQGTAADTPPRSPASPTGTAAPEPKQG